MAISTSSQTTDAPGLLTRITKRSSAFLKLKSTQPCWPDAEDSTGSFYDTVDGEKYWNLKNQDCSAFLKFSQLSKTLASILRKHTEAPTVLARWKAYMIGESAPLCALGILFCCGDTEYLKTAASHISASGAVDETSGVIVKFRSSLPRYKGKLIHLGLGRQGVGFLPGAPGPRDGGLASSPMEPHVYHVPLSGSQSTEQSHSSTIEALGYSPQCFTKSEAIFPGNAVYVEMSVEGIRTATIGGRVKWGHQEFFMTAAHPFTYQRSEAEAASGKERLPTELEDTGYLYYSSCFNGRPELDYALIQPKKLVKMFRGPALHFSDSAFALPKFTSEEDFRELVETIIRTSSASAGVLVGELDTIPEFLETPGATELQEVYAAHFESVLAPGDSGSWVYNAEHDILHGHIVAGIPEEGLALIVPAYQVFADLTKSFVSVPEQYLEEESASGNRETTRPIYTPTNPTDYDSPCNTLYVGNLPANTSEDELKALFARRRGYKRLCFRTKQNGPMCLVEFEDISVATDALNELDGYMLHGSVKDGIRLGFLKKSLGVRRMKPVQGVIVDEDEPKEPKAENTQRETDDKVEVALAESGPSMDLKKSGTTGRATPISQAAQGSQITSHVTTQYPWFKSESGRIPWSSPWSSLLWNSESLSQYIKSQGGQEPSEYIEASSKQGSKSESVDSDANFLIDHGNVDRVPPTGVRGSIGLASPAVLEAYPANSLVPFSEALVTTGNDRIRRIRPKAYLENFSSNTTEDDLKLFFADCRVTDVRIVRVDEYKDGRREEFAEIEFATFGGLSKAQRICNTQFRGENLRLSRTKPNKASPLRGCSVAIAESFFSFERGIVEQRITVLGGSVKSHVTLDTDILIASRLDVELMTPAVAAASLNSIPIVSIDWLNKTKEDNAKADVTQFSLETRLQSRLKYQLPENVSKRVKAHSFAKDQPEAGDYLEWCDFMGHGGFL